MVEPGTCPATYTDQQIATIASDPGGLWRLPRHPDRHPELLVADGLPEGCKAFVARVNTAGGKAEMMHLPERGIRGNSHMIMQDNNNLLVADLILKWIGTMKESQRPRRLN